MILILLSLNIKAGIILTWTVTSVGKFNDLAQCKCEMEVPKLAYR